MKLTAGEFPPPEGGLTTAMVTAPAAATSAAVIDAVSCVALTYEVTRLLPFHCTVELETKLLPFTVSVNPTPAALVALGESDEIAGTMLGVLTDITTSVVEADCVGSAAEVAVIVTCPTAEEVSNSPELEMVPADADQSTRLLKLPVPCTEAAHWALPFAKTTELLQDKLTEPIA